MQCGTVKTSCTVLSDEHCALPTAVEERISSVRAGDGEPFVIHSPIDGSPLVALGSCGIPEARRAPDRAEQAFHAWKGRTAYERSAILRRWLELIESHANPMAELMSLEMGKPVTEAAGEIRYGASFVEWYAEEAKRVSGEILSSQYAHKRIHLLRQPSGVVYGITPWNFPVAMVTRKVAPALAAGCTFILKPAEETPLRHFSYSPMPTWRRPSGRSWHASSETPGRHASVRIGSMSPLPAVGSVG